MCGRFTQRLSSSDVARLFGAHDLVESAGEAYNVAPTQRVAVVVEREDERVRYPVAPLVNSVRHQGPALIAPLLPG